MAAGALGAVAAAAAGLLFAQQQIQTVSDDQCQKQPVYYAHKHSNPTR